MPLVPVRTVEVRTHLGDFGGMSAAALVQCDDGNKYVIKRSTLGRPLVAEHVVGRLGRRMGAPCMEIALAIVPIQLIQLDPNLARFAGGVAHATAFVPNVVEHKGIQHAQFPRNRERFARLLLLFSWMLAADHQYMYELSAPHLVYSHDHGLFFPGSQNWSPTTLAANVEVALDGPISGGTGIQPPDIRAAAVDLRTVTQEEIAEAVGSVPNDWGVPVADLDALAVCLSARRINLLNVVDQLPA